MKKVLDILVAEIAVVLLWADAEDIVIFGRER
jgi:hypothetical protein